MPDISFLSSAKNCSFSSIGLPTWGAYTETTFRIILPTASLKDNSLSLYNMHQQHAQTTSPISLHQHQPNHDHNHSSIVCTLHHQLQMSSYFHLSSAFLASNIYPNAFSSPSQQILQFFHAEYQHLYSPLSTLLHQSRPFATLDRPTARVQGMPPCCAPDR